MARSAASRGLQATVTTIASYSYLLHPSGESAVPRATILLLTTLLVVPFALPSTTAINVCYTTDFLPGDFANVVERVEDAIVTRIPPGSSTMSVIEPTACDAADDTQDEAQAGTSAAIEDTHPWLRGLYDVCSDGTASAGLGDVYYVAGTRQKMAGTGAGGKVGVSLRDGVVSIQATGEPNGAGEGPGFVGMTANSLGDGTITLDDRTLTDAVGEAKGYCGAPGGPVCAASGRATRTEAEASAYVEAVFNNCGAPS